MELSDIVEFANEEWKKAQKEVDEIGNDLVEQFWANPPYPWVKGKPTDKGDYLLICQSCGHYRYALGKANGKGKIESIPPFYIANQIVAYQNLELPFEASTSEEGSEET